MRASTAARGRYTSRGSCRCGVLPRRCSAARAQSAVPTQALDQLTELGELVDTRGEGHIQTFVHDFGPDLKVISDVFWIEPHEGDHDHE